MLLRTGMPKTLLWVLNLLVIYLLLFTGFRLAVMVAFLPEQEQLANLVPSLLLGFRFDMRWISMLLAPIVIASLYPAYSPFYSHRNRKAWTWYLAAVTLVVVFFFAADFGCFSYNHTRLNASALNFAEDPAISLHMLWESYPLFWMICGLFAAVLLLRWVFMRSHIYVFTRTDGKGIRYQRRWFIAATFFLALFVYGSFTTQPLKWKSAFVLEDGFRSHLALNPLQSFFTTLKFRAPDQNTAAIKEHYNTVTNWMGLPAGNGSYHRITTPGVTATKVRPNVVLVVCESFSMYKSSMSGNPLNTTPYFQNLTKDGVFFERCFTPHFSTARGLFATITGIPDVQLSKFSTRNEQALDQHTIINEFKGYQKFYFLGGDPSFNNFEGLLQNIDGLQMITQKDFASKPVNVWGISDKDLFLEANGHLASQKEPFFAIIQTADNHRPFLIPEGEKKFKKLVVPDDTLKKYGFESLEEYNAFRYADFSIAQFMEAARKEDYFANTVFVFVGDHGVSGNASAMYNNVWTRERLTDEHVPLLFYAPQLLQPQKHSEVVSQIDVLPTIAGLTGIPYLNTTLGRDVLQSKKNDYAFIIHHDEGRIGMVTNDFYFTSNLNFKKEELHFFGTPTYTSKQQDSIKKELSAATTAYYQTAKWMLVNNKKTFAKK